MLDVRLFGRHQVTAAVGTAADFTTMIALVELAALPPPSATIASSTVGAVVNFLLSRAWAFHHRHRGTAVNQAARYVFVAAGCSLLNAALLAAVLRVASIPYPVARALASILVSVCYTYPLHTGFVFRVGDAERGAARVR